MKNDRPTSLRMGFGYGEVRAAGLGGIRQARSPNQVNKYIKAKKVERNSVVSLREYSKDPEWAPLIEHRVKQGRKADEICTEIYWVERYAWAKSKGFSLAYRLRCHWPH